MDKLLNSILEGAVRCYSDDDFINEIKENNEAIINKDEVIIVDSGEFTGRSPKDRFIVDNSAAKNVEWNSINQPITQEKFDYVYGLATEYVAKKKMYLHKGYAGVDIEHQLTLNVLSEKAWQSYFANQIFVRGEADFKESDWTIMVLPDMKLDPERDKTRSEVFIGLDFERGLVLIIGTSYAGEIKKSIFGVMNYILPDSDVFPMHCSANTDSDGKTTLFFGLSGTGKTTLSMNPKKQLVGDDEHGWNGKGIFNFEGASYAKIDGLTEEKDPVIYHLINKGTIVENVNLKDGVLDFSDTSKTSNLRACITVDKIETMKSDYMAGQPTAVLFLSADAYGVLPPISKLTKEQAMYYFMSGYTSKIPGTERGVVEPILVFSECFGAPFMPRAAIEYAEMLKKKITERDIPVYLINTGWFGGKYGTGSRIKLKYTRRMVEAAVEGELDNTEFVVDDKFGLSIPTFVEGVPQDLLYPERNWEDLEEYHSTVNGLIEQFKMNFKKFSHLEGIESILKGQPKGE